MREIVEAPLLKAQRDILDIKEKFGCPAHCASRQDPLR